MASFRAATPDQQAFFRAHDLQCPRTEDVARSLINYIEQDRYGGTREERLTKVRDMQTQWIGQIVCHIKTGASLGSIRHLTARSPQMMRHECARASIFAKTQGKDYTTPSWFMAVIDPPKKRDRAVTIGLEHLLPPE